MYSAFRGSARHSRPVLIRISFPRQNNRFFVSRRHQELFHQSSFKQPGGARTFYGNAHASRGAQDLSSVFSLRNNNHASASACQQIRNLLQHICQKEATIHEQYFIEPSTHARKHIRRHRGSLSQMLLLLQRSDHLSARNARKDFQGKNIPGHRGFQAFPL